MRWNGHRAGRETRKASVTAIKGKDNFRTVEVTDSEDCLKELDIRHLAGWRWLRTKQSSGVLTKDRKSGYRGLMSEQKVRKCRYKNRPLEKLDSKWMEKEFTAGVRGERI